MRKIGLISILTLVTVALISILILANHILQQLSADFLLLADLYNFFVRLSFLEAIALFYGILIASSFFVFGFYPSRRVAG